jgi:AmpE protein
MNIIAMLLALGAERLFPHGTALGEPRLLRWLLKLMGNVPKSLAKPGASALPWLLTIALAALTAVIHQQLPGQFWPVVFAGLVLFLCLGPRDLADDVQRLIAARTAGDADQAQRIAVQLQQGPKPDEGHRSLLGALFIQSHERLFGVLLWFILLGPAAAVAYRAASRLPRLLQEANASETTQTAAAQLHGALAWLPARATAGLFALAGSMDDALTAWRRVGELHFVEVWRSHTWAVLAEVSTAALAAEEADGAVTVAPDLSLALREVLRMQTRALLMLLAAYSVFAVGTLT